MRKSLESVFVVSGARQEGLVASLQGDFHWFWAESQPSVAAAFSKDQEASPQNHVGGWDFAGEEENPTLWLHWQGEAYGLTI